MRIECAVGLAIAVLVTSGASHALDLVELMSLLAQNRGSEASYHEVRHVQGLDAPLRSSGTLSYSAPDRFTRQMQEPRMETVTVAGNTLTLSKNGKTRNLALDSVPELSTIVEALRGTLAGDGQALQRWFRPQVEGSTEQWSLRLVPIEARTAARVSSVLIGGRRGDVRKVEVLLADGDRSVMDIEPSAPGKRAAPAR